MQKVYQSTNINEASLIRSILDTNGIPNVMRNELLQGATGEVPFTSVWPEVWVLDDADAERSLELIANKSDQPAHADWTCKTCVEQIEGEFDACWKCGALRT